LVAGLHGGGGLWFAYRENVGPIIERAAPELGIDVTVVRE